MASKNFIYKINEEHIFSKLKYFVGYEELKKKYIQIGNIVFNSNNLENVDVLDLLDISGKILLYGDPGTGKTSLAYYIANYFLNELEIESYKISIPDLIQSNLGLTTKNMNDAIKEIKFLSENGSIVLIIDELDRISVERSNGDEISELKRSLIEFLDFLDEVKYTNKILIIGITNSLELLDKALIRRFDFVDEIIANESDLINLFDLVLKKLKIDNVYQNEKIEFIRKYNTGDKIKKCFKKMYLETEGISAEIKLYLENEIGGLKI